MATFFDVNYVQGEPKKMFQHENYDIWEMRTYFCTKFCSFVYKTILCTHLLLCAVFTWHSPNWWKRKLQEQILQLHRLYKRLILLLMLSSAQYHLCCDVIVTQA